MNDLRLRRRSGRMRRGSACASRRSARAGRSSTGTRRHSRARGAFWPLLLLLLLLLLLRSAAALRGARRMAAEPPVLALGERLRRGRRGGRLDRRGATLHGYRRGAPDLALDAQVLLTHDHRALHAGGGAEHARAHLVGVQRHMRAAGDEARRQARIDPEPATLDPHRTVDEAGFAQHDHAAIPRHKMTAQLRLADIAQRHVHPVVRLLVVGVDQIVRRQRRPADVVAAIAPVDPGRRPFVARHPEPADGAVEGPAAVVIDHPAPVVLVLVGDPVPAPVVGEDPVAVLIRLPVGWHAIRHPDLTVRCMADPMAVSLERGGHVFGGLRHSRRERTGHNRHRNAGNGEREASRRAEQEAAD